MSVIYRRAHGRSRDDRGECRAPGADGHGVRYQRASDRRGRYKAEHVVVNIERRESWKEG